MSELGNETETETQNCPDYVYELYCQKSKVRILDLSFSDVMLLCGHDGCCGDRMRKANAQEETK